MGFGKRSHSQLRPTLYDLMTQTSVYGTVIPRIYGMTKSSLKVIWANGLTGGSSGKKGKGGGKKGGPTTYVAAMDFLIGSNPIVATERWWKNGQQLGLNFMSNVYSASGSTGQTLTISDPAFYHVIGVTAGCNFSGVTFDDYGSSTALSGTSNVPVTYVEYHPTTHFSGATGGGCVNPTNVYDTNNWTYGEMKVNPGSDDKGDTFYGFASHTAGASWYIKIISDAWTNERSVVNLRYSLDNGSTWHVIYQITGMTQRQRTTDSIPIPAGTDISQIKVRGEVHPGPNSNSADQRLYEIWVQTDTVASTGSGIVELPLWNVEFTGPNPTDASGWTRFPFTYRWVPGTNTVFLENHDAIGAGPYLAAPSYYVVYYSQFSSPDGAPIGVMRCTFEPQLGDGSEYTNYPTEQILYPMYAGCGSPDYDLGTGPALPEVYMEVLGTWPFYPTGDADLPDIVEDIVKQGQGQAALEIASYSDMQFGLSLFDYPGTVQKKWNGNFANGAWYDGVSYYNPKYDRPNTAGNVLIACASNGSLVPSFSDTAGNTWTNVFPGSLDFQVGYVIGCAAYNQNVVSTGFTGTSDLDWSTFLFELAGVDTLDATDYSVTTSSQTQLTVTTTNNPGEPAYIFVYVRVPSGSTLPTVVNPNLWKPLISNLTGNYAAPTLDCTYYRIVRYPGTYTITLNYSTSTSWGACMLAFKNSQPPKYSFPLGDIIDKPSMDNARAQCQAYGLQGSLTMDSARKASDWLTELYTVMNTWPVWSGFKLKSIAMAERSMFANGAVYTAPTAAGPVASLSTSDFVGDKPSLHITIKRTAIGNSNTSFQIQHPDRSNKYSSALVSVPDNGAIALRGAKKKESKTFPVIQDTNVARAIVGVMTRRSVYLLNKYSFNLQAKWCMLETGDLVLLNDELQGIENLPVRLIKAELDENYQVACEAEDFMYNLNTPSLLPYTENQQPDSGITYTAGSVNTPFMFVVPPTLEGGGTKVWLRIFLSGANASWGGALIYASTDGTTYSAVGSQVGQSTMGLTTAIWGSGSDPDTANDLLVDLSESFGTLADFSTTDENNLLPLIAVNGTTPEIGAYGIATQTGAYAYTLSASGGNFLRRGLFGTAIASHPLGSQFGYMGPNSIFTDILVNPQWYGKTVYFKFPSFNTFQTQTQALSDCTAYPFTFGNGNVNQYVQNPMIALTQPTGTQIAMAAVDEEFPSNTAHYNARTFTITNPSSPTVYYVYIQDPTQLGDPGTSTALTAFCTTSNTNVGIPGYTYIGFIQAIPGGGAGAVAGPGGWPPPTVGIINGG